MSESEFKVKDPKPPSVPFMRLMIDALRRAKQEHPVADMAAESLPFVGAMGAGLDVTDPNASTLTKGLALASVIPGGKLGGALIKRLRGVENKIPAKVVEKMAEEKSFSPEEIFQKPDIVMSPEQRAKNLQDKNDQTKAIARQWLIDNGITPPEE